MNNKLKLGFIISAMTLMPGLAFAQWRVLSWGDLVDFFYDVIYTLIPIIVSLAVLVFIWGVFRYVVSPNEEDKARGKQVMIWGIVGIFVMVSVWGLVNIIEGTLGLDSDRYRGNFPEVPEPESRSGPSGNNLVNNNPSNTTDSDPYYWIPPNDDGVSPVPYEDL